MDIDDAAEDAAENTAAPELSVPLETVCYVVKRARDLQGKSASSLMDDEAGDPDDIEGEVLEDRAADAVAAELEHVISDLAEDAQADLVALMWLGRDEGGDWSELRAIAEQEHTDATAAYLLGTPHLADHLLAGLEAWGLDCDSYEGEGL